MHHEARRLVDHEERRVAVHHAERQAGLAGRDPLIGLELGLDPQALPAREPPPPLRRGIGVDLHASAVDPTLEAGA
jgi:hypothetical protein